MARGVWASDTDEVCSSIAGWVFVVGMVVRQDRTSLASGEPGEQDMRSAEVPAVALDELGAQKALPALEPGPLSLLPEVATPLPESPTPEKFLSLQERHQRLILRYKSSYRVEKAISEIGKYLELYDDDAWAYMQRSECHMMLGRYEEAEEDARTAMRLGYNPVEVHRLLAQICVRWGQMDQARAHYEEAFLLAPGNAQIHYEAGLFYGAVEEYEDAVYQFQLALRLHPDHPDYLLALGSALESQGNLDQALLAYQRRIELTYAPPERYFQLGLLYMEKQRYQQAVENLEKLEAEMPDDYRTHLLLGQAYAGVQEYTQALESFVRAHQLRSREVQPLLAIAQVSRMMNDANRALQAYARVLLLDATNVEAHFGRARVFSELGQLEQARQAADRASAIVPGNAKILALRAALELARGDAQGAEEFLAQVQDDPQRAREFCQEFLKRIPEQAKSSPSPESVTDGTKGPSFTPPEIPSATGQQIKTGHEAGDTKIPDASP